MPVVELSQLRVPLLKAAVSAALAVVRANTEPMLTGT